MTARGHTHRLCDLTIEPAVPREPQIAGSSELRRARPRTIALFGLFGCGNLGNDASLQAILELIREERPNARLICICDRPDLVSTRFGVRCRAISGSRHLYGLPRRLHRTLGKLAGRVWDLASTLGALRGVDLMIVPGTGILDDFGERPYGMPLDLFRWCLAARLLGAKVAMVSIGAGPIRHPLSRRLMKAAAGLAHYRSYRDAQSRDFLKSIGFDTRCDEIYPDIVFRLEEPKAPPIPHESSRLQVGVGLMSYCGWYGFADGSREIFERYSEKMVQFVSYMLDAGNDVRLLTGEAGDVTAVDRILAGLVKARPEAASARVVSEPIETIGHLMEQIAKTDLVVATRFHNVVCALKMGRPTISIGYARKNDVLMERMGLGAYCHHVETFEPEAIRHQIAELAGAREHHAERIIRCRSEIRRRLAVQDRHLLATLL